MGATILVGAWLAIIGYGLVYAGTNKLGGGNCTLRQAFLGGGCQAPDKNQSASAPKPQNQLAALPANSPVPAAAPAPRSQTASVAQGAIA